MAGSYNHVVEDDGSLASNETVAGMLENGGDVFEAVEQMYGMIWYLAERLNANLPAGAPAFRDLDRLDLVEEARKNYQQGLRWSPTDRYRSNDGTEHRY